MLAKAGSGSLDDESFWKLFEGLRGDTRLGRIETPVQAGWTEWVLATHEIDAERWRPEGGEDADEALDLLLPAGPSGHRLLIRLLDQNAAALYTGMFDGMDLVRARRTLDAVYDVEPSA